MHRFINTAACNAEFNTADNSVLRCFYNFTGAGDKSIDGANGNCFIRGVFIQRNRPFACPVALIIGRKLALGNFIGRKRNFNLALCVAVHGRADLKYPCGIFQVNHRKYCTVKSFSVFIGFINLNAAVINKGIVRQVIIGVGVACLCAVRAVAHPLNRHNFGASVVAHVD